MLDFEKLSQDLITYRRDLHQIPELGFYVYKTSAYVCQILSQLSCQVEKIVQTGVIAYFDFRLRGNHGLPCRHGRPSHSGGNRPALRVDP